MIIAYLGTRGRGKTLSLVREAYEHYNKGYNIYSNIKLNDKKFKQWTMIDGKMLLAWVNGDKQFKKAFFILDEVHVYLDSRMGMSKRSIIISYFILQTRKRNVRLGYTTQFFNQVDKRLRNPTEVFVDCHNFKGEDGKIRNRNLVTFLESGRMVYQIFEAEKYFEYYDTDEIVNPFKDKN